MSPNTNFPSSTATFYITSSLSVTDPPPNNYGLLNELNDKLTPLDWYAGFQPLLLTLPKNKLVNDLHWISLFDHNKKVSFSY